MEQELILSRWALGSIQQTGLILHRNWCSLGYWSLLPMVYPGDTPHYASHGQRPLVVNEEHLSQYGLSGNTNALAKPGAPWFPANWLRRLGKCLPRPLLNP